MSKKRNLSTGLAVLASVLSTSLAMAGPADRHNAATGLVREVRIGTAEFRDVDAAIAAGYGSSGACVSGPEEGAMGIHFPNGDLVNDPGLDPRRPELLIYEQQERKLRLVGVEFIVIAEAWHQNNANPPVLMGQQFHYVGSPNRYGLPAFYELHVWAWKENPNGMFVDWNPHVSCEEFEGN